MANKNKVAAPTRSEIRRNILRWFYDLNKKGGASKGMQDLCRGVKDAYDYKAPLVKEHLTYLCDLGYVYKETVMTQVRTGQTMREQPKVSYRVSAKGIEFMEGKSEFSDKERYPGINIKATGGSTVVLGDGNIVNSTYRPLYDELGKLLHAVADSSELNDSAKLEVSVNIETIRDQLALDRPSKTIVDTAWETANRICTTGTLAEYAVRIAPMIAALF